MKENLHFRRTVNVMSEFQLDPSLKHVSNVVLVTQFTAMAHKSYKLPFCTVEQY